MRALDARVPDRCSTEIAALLPSHQRDELLQIVRTRRARRNQLTRVSCVVRASERVDGRYAGGDVEILGSYLSSGR